MDDLTTVHILHYFLLCTAARVRECELSLFSSVVDLKYIFTLFSTENDRSAESFDPDVHSSVRSAPIFG